MKNLILASGLILTAASAATAQVASDFTPAPQALAEVQEENSGDNFRDLWTTTSGEILIVIDRGSAAVKFSSSTMANILRLCDNGGDLSLNIGDGIPVTTEGFNVLVGGVDSGYDCPMPVAVGPYAEHISNTWLMYAGHGNGEFTAEHLRETLGSMAGDPQGEIITRLDVPRGYVGNDRFYIDRALTASITGQLTGWIVDEGNVVYFIVKDTCLEICSGPAIVWHLHKGIASARQTPSVGTTPATNQRPEPAVAPTSCITPTGAVCG